MKHLVIRNVLRFESNLPNTAKLQLKIILQCPAAWVEVSKFAHTLSSVKPRSKNVLIWAEMLGMQDSQLLRIKPRFLAVDEGDTVVSSTVTDRSREGSLSWDEEFSVMKVELEVICSFPS